MSTQMTIQEMFQSSLINKSGFGMDEYRMVPTLHYITETHSFGKSPRTNIQSEALKRAGEPDPRKYCESSEQAHKRHWVQTQGKFLYCLLYTSDAADE